METTVVQRRNLLKAGAAAPLAAALGVFSEEAEARRKNLKGMNVLVFITDQQRATMHFPKNWEKQNLPGAQRLKKHGLVFQNAVCNACMCSPSRATLMTGYFPAQHGVKYTLEENMSPPDNPQVNLPLDFKNIASVMRSAGYNVPYKGKWHLSKQTQPPDWVPEDVSQYGFERWDCPDAGANQAIDQFGGGTPDNDGRFIEDDGVMEAGDEGVLAYLDNVATDQQPFFMIVSLVNPHDVLAYPSTYIQGGYDNSWLKGNIGLPETVKEDLSTKPSAQAAFLQISNGGLGALTTNDMKKNYLNFYGNTIKSSDEYLVRILDKLDDLGITDNTLVIQTSDHGEMGMTHGGQRQKSFNFYEETLRVPLVYSNPKLYKKKKQSKALVSHVDFLPTLASLFAAPNSARANWQGVDYSKLVLDPDSKKDIQDYTVFTYDDYQCGQPTGPYVPAPNHIVSIREKRYKLAKYFDADGVEADQWEMYDLKKDPLEKQNLAAPGFKRSKKQQKQYKRMKDKLTKVENTRLAGPV